MSRAARDHDHLVARPEAVELHEEVEGALHSSRRRMATPRAWDAYSIYSHG